MRIGPSAPRQSRILSALAPRATLLALGPTALWLGITLGVRAVGTQAVADWTQLVVVVTGWGLAAWGAWWSLCCVLTLVARLCCRVSGEAPTWAAKLPRSCLAAAGLAAGAALSTMAPAQATTAPSTIVSSAVPSHQESEGDRLTPTWPLERTPEGAAEVEDGRPEQDAPERSTRPTADRPSTEVPRTWTAPKRAQRLPSVLGAAGRQHVTVQPGDSLWSLAARHLGGSASDHDIAEEWPRWYRANREVIGPDPNLLVPGTTLLPPAI